MKLFDITANGIYFGNPWHHAQLRPDDPVLYFTEVGGRIGCPVRFSGFVFCINSPHEYLAESGRDWPHCRLYIHRQLVFCLLQPLAHQLSRKIDIGPVLEDDGNLRSEEHTSELQS